MHEQLVIIGARGHGKVAADIARKLGKYQKLIFLDDDDTLKDSMGIPVVGKSTEMYKYANTSDVFVAVGSADVRKRLIEHLQNIGAEVPILVHPQAVVGSGVSLGAGTAVMAGAVINPDATVGKGCIINTCASVDHDCIIGDYTHIAVGAHLAGNVRVGEEVWVGAGVTVKNNIDICDKCVIGAGAVVVKNIKSAGTYIGVPAGRMAMKGMPGKRVEGLGGVKLLLYNDGDRMISKSSFLIKEKIYRRAA